MSCPVWLLECVFCGIVAGTEKGHILYDGEDVIAFLDTHPIERGHTLVVPKRHREMITDMDSGEVGALFSQVQPIAKAVVAGTGADAFTLAQNNGEAARQTVPHVHVHIIPRYSGKEAAWRHRLDYTEAELDEMASKIRACL